MKISDLVQMIGVAVAVVLVATLAVLTAGTLPH